MISTFPFPNHPKTLMPIGEEERKKEREEEERKWEREEESKKEKDADEADENSWHFSIHWMSHLSWRICHNEMTNMPN